MNRFILITLLIVIPTAFVACHRESESVAPAHYQKAFPLKVGNYWLYRTITINPDGSKNFLNKLDSIWIEKDTLIGNKLYYVQKHSLFHNYSFLLSDSAGIIFSETPNYKRIVFSATHHDTLVSAYPRFQIMADLNQAVSVPAGNFRTVSVKTIEKMTPASHAGHSGVPMHGNDFMVLEQLTYANQVGLVKRVTSFHGSVAEEVLVRYKVN